MADTVPHARLSHSGALKALNAAVRRAGEVSAAGVAAVTDDSGRRQRSSSTEEESPGTPLGDVWEIGIVAPIARERTGYPTQKPEALLERLVQAVTDPEDLVLDPYAGSGTTLAVCARLGRRSVGIDASPEALRIIRRRLREQGVRPLEEKVRAAEPRVQKARAAERDDDARLAG